MREYILKGLGSWKRFHFPHLIWCCLCVYQVHHLECSEDCSFYTSFNTYFVQGFIMKVWWKHGVVSSNSFYASIETILIFNLLMWWFDLLICICWNFPVFFHKYLLIKMPMPHFPQKSSYYTDILYSFVFYFGSYLILIFKNFLRLPLLPNHPNDPQDPKARSSDCTETICISILVLKSQNSHNHSK